jgi:hypothetical protein
MKTLSFLAFVLALASLLTARAETPEEKGLAIAREADHRNLGYGDNAVPLTMTIIDEQGGTLERKMEVQTLEIKTPGEGDKSLVTFSQPRDVQGTALLTHTHVQSNDDQWLYLPALKRVKRISSSNKTGAFMGSEFAYEDMVPQVVEKFRYKYLRDETCGALQCFVVESYPAYADSGYKRLVVWTDQTEYRIFKIEFYDLSGALLKTLTAADYRSHLGKYWRPYELFMINHQNKKSTRMAFQPYRFRTGLKAEYFDQANLQRMR